MKNEFSPKLPERREEFDKFPASPFAPGLVEKMLMALIAANDVPAEIYGENARGALHAMRLNLAMKAIFGAPMDPEPINDLPTLVAGAQRNVWNESERQLDIHERREDHEGPVKSVRGPTPFSEIVGLAGSTSSEGGDERALYNRLLGKYKKAEVFEYLSFITNHAEHPEEKAMMADLEKLGEILARWNVMLSLDPESLGMHSLSHGWSEQ